MLIIGCDYHPSVQQIAFVDTETGDYGEHRLKHSDGEAEKFYRDLKLRESRVCESGWKPQAIRDGSNDCWRSWAMSLDWRCGADHGHACPEAEDGPTGRRSFC